jgi:hypothetical protein
MILIFFNMNDNGQFAMSHGSYDSNLGSKRLILAGDIRSRSWPNIGDSYGTMHVRKCIKLGDFILKNCPSVPHKLPTCFVSSRHYCQCF